MADADRAAEMPSAVAPEPQAPSDESPALKRLRQAMAEQHAYRREGLTVASLATDLGCVKLRCGP